MNMRGRFLAVFLMIMMAVGLFPAVAMAETPNIIWVERNYNYVHDFNEGLARVEILFDDEEGSRWRVGFVDKMGIEVVPLIYVGAWDFNEGLAWVLLDGRWGIIKNPLSENGGGGHTDTITLEITRDLSVDNVAIITFYDSFRMLQTVPLAIPAAATDIRIKIWSGFRTMRPLMDAVEIE